MLHKINKAASLHFEAAFNILKDGLNVVEIMGGFLFLSGRCLRFVQASLPTTQDSLSAVTKPYRTGLGTCRVC